MAELRTGQHAPQFELPTADGRLLTLKAFLGKPVVVYFYPQDDTTSCTAEAIDFSRLKPEFTKAGAVVIGISPDSAKKHGKFKTKYDLSVDLAADEERKRSRPMIFGWKKACSAANIWASNGQRS